MRKIGGLPSEQQAKRFEDYLLTQEIGANIEASSDQWTVWVYDEDQVERAKAELAAFEADPEADKYQSAARQSDAIREEKRLKAWRRKWKIELIEQTYRQWTDLDDNLNV